ncbi:MAG TPA: hypothetical protein VHE33_20695 [Acidobacteriaceae bacterium]|nr:hypothetical protein [Acidobacteriaceae bacterium]
MKKSLIAALLGSAAFCSPVQPACAQQAFWEHFESRKVAMAGLQPAWIAPLIESDPRLMQGVRLSVSNANAPGARIVSYGNNHGVGVIAGTRFQFDFNPPSFFRNHSAELPDGWGNASTQVKFRIASGNASHGNFAVSAMVEHGFAPGASQKGILTSYNITKLAAGKAFGPFAVQSTLGGVLPTGRIEEQGRAVEWNIAGQFHVSSRTWLDIENNAAFLLGGANDGKTQNFITPAAFLIMKRNGWGPRHPIAVLDGGMQIATSRFYCYNHNLITEVRILF